MGEVRDLWDWEPLTVEQKLHLEALAPDRRLGRAAALEYLERNKEVVINITPPVIVPVAILLILAGLLGISAAFLR